MSSSPQMTRTGTRIFGARREHPVGDGHGRAGRRDDDVAGAIPVEHGGQRAGAAPFGDARARCSAGSIVARSTWPAKLLSKKLSTPIAATAASIAGCAEGGDILRGGALVGVLDQRLLEDPRVGRVDDGEPLDARIAAQRRRPGDRAAPIVADQREAVDAAAHRRARTGRRSACRWHRRRRPAGGRCRPKPRRSGMIRRKRSPSSGASFAPGAVRFGEAVEQDDRRRVGRAGLGDVHGDPGRQRRRGAGRSRIADRLRARRGWG